MQIALPSSVRKKICRELSLSGRRETGGLLLAEQLDDQGRFRVVDVTVDPSGGESAYFERRPELHAQALEAFFEKNGNDFGRFNYLGEWHSHPSFSIDPSTTDIRTMQAMVEDVGNIDFSVLMIVRLRMFVMLQVGAYLFMRGQHPQRVKMIDDPAQDRKEDSFEASPSVRQLEGEMSKTATPPKVANALWAKAAGRCQFRGCNKLLIGDLIAGKRTGKFGYIAHIVADEAGGPRGDTVRSLLLAQEIDNLMLMCPVHHKAIDVDYLADYPEDVLLAMKAEHEDRIEIVTDMDVDRVSHVVRFAATIGQRDSLVTIRSIFSAMPPDHHPAEGRTIDIELIGSERKDHEEAYWTEQNENLERLFARKIKERIEQREVRQLSVFALAPQPLLIRLGTLLGDIVPVSVHQKHREPDTWKWLPDQPRIAYKVNEYNGRKDVPIALKLALSATVNDERITLVLGEDTAIWSITCDQPGNDVMRRKDDLGAYKQLVRDVFNRIKAYHGEGVLLHVFPALPASAAVETGRVWMPKADLAIKIYDQNRTAQAFVPTITIG